MSTMTAEYGVKWRGTKPVYCVQRDVYRCRCNVRWSSIYIHTKEYAGPSGSRATLLFLTLPLASIAGASQIGNNEAIQVLLTPMVSPSSPQHLRLPVKVQCP